MTVPVGEYPVTVAVQVLDEPTITIEGAHPTATLLRTGFTVSVNAADPVFWGVAVSFAVTVTMYDPEPTLLGVQIIETELELPHPVGRPDHT